MPARGPHGESRHDILRAAARLFQERGYEATSMQDMATATHLSKAALYHHFDSKEDILVEIMTFGLDAVEARVIKPVEEMGDPEARLRACIERHVEMVTNGRDREVLVVLYENRTLPPVAGAQINARKKQYVQFLGGLIHQVQARRRMLVPQVQPQIAGLALLGMMNWMVQWYRPEGGISGAEIARQYAALVFAGAFAED